jgi:hypothetical protein
MRKTGQDKVRNLVLKVRLSKGETPQAYYSLRQRRPS